MNSSVCNEGDRSQCANNNGVVDLLGSQKYVQVNYSNKVLKLNAFEPIECIYDVSLCYLQGIVSRWKCFSTLSIDKK
jgi:hypothetical protein